LSKIHTKSIGKKIMKHINKEYKKKKKSILFDKFLPLSYTCSKKITPKFVKNPYKTQQKQ
jgi:hypothetical protein